MIFLSGTKWIAFAGNVTRYQRRERVKPRLSFPFFLRQQHGSWGAGLQSEASLPLITKDSVTIWITIQPVSRVTAWDLGQ